MPMDHRRASSTGSSAAEPLDLALELCDEPLGSCELRLQDVDLAFEHHHVVLALEPA